MERNGKNCNKISGYLEKKGKMKMMNLYKKYWFVLEGGLLLYYRSKDDYETLSPCKGSINLGPPCIVKPCTSLHGVFQIQTRIATVTLRAETRDDQNKWMQAIISEINPQKTLQRMSHFRYSMENVQQSKEQIPNSTPESQSSLNSNEDIIHRIQKMGAQSYNPINEIANLRRKKSTPSPDILFEENLNRDSKSSEHIYERISAEYKECLLDDKSDVEVKKSMTLPAQKINTLRIKKEDNRPKTFIIENDTYAISIQQKFTETIPIKEYSKEKEKEVKKSKQKLKHRKSFFTKRRPQEENFMVENEAYASVQKREILNVNNEKLRDHNENSLLKEDNREENHYSMPSLPNECNPNEGLYEVIEKQTVEYVEPYLHEAEEENKLIQKEEAKKNKLKMKKKKIEEKTDDTNKLKKRSSFIRRVWKKKEKREKTEENKVEEEDELYETVSASVVEKVCVTDATAVKMLSELQNILEHKMPILMEKISHDMNSTKNSNPSEHLEATEGLQREDSKKNVMQKEKIFVFLVLPLVPPKTQKLDTAVSPCHDIPSNNKPIALPPKKKKMETVKTLDEILSELDTQKPETNKNKVKKLIKRFSEPEFAENGVVLRNCKRNYIHREEDIDSDELSRLLEELAKVTNAPILIPGVTSSLNGAHMPDKELTKLLPAKQRRFSEPDYDIPRPHKSLTIINKKDVAENVIGSTRFFGPILKPSDMIVPNGPNPSEPSSQLNSITPDSLEHNTRHLTSSATTQQDEENIYPHHYNKFMDSKTFHEKTHSPTYATPNLEKNCESLIVDNELYAEPRSIQMNFELTKNKAVDYEQDDEVFVDSLEVCKNEVSTEF